MLRVFVDGAYGTVGMALQPHLEALRREGLIDLICLTPDARRDEGSRRGAFQAADVVVLCLPDDAAPAAVQLIETVNPSARILDASATHRCAPGWVYGLPELISPAAIARASRVANPGCFATACVLAGKPLAEAFGVTHLQFQGLTGYSAAGNKGNAEGKPQVVQFGRAHRHLPEIARYTGTIPVLTTVVGPWERGMLVQTFLPLSESEVLACYKAFYAQHPLIAVQAARDVNYRVDPLACNNSNRVQLVVAEQANGCSVAVVLDNLGKGAAGAAASNLRLMVS